MLVISALVELRSALDLVRCGSLAGNYRYMQHNSVPLDNTAIIPRRKRSV